MTTKEIIVIVLQAAVALPLVYAFFVFMFAM